MTICVKKNNKKMDVKDFRDQYEAFLYEIEKEKLLTSK